ncbi:MAG: hypothetical protein ACR2GB_06010 [Nocardioidaceae bacterium]
MSDTVGDFWVITLIGAVAVAGGGPLTMLVFKYADRARRRRHTGNDSVEAAGELLRGGAWIGVLERFAAYGTLLAGWPEGLALIVAVKGLGRYSELRQVEPGTAERFLIGTFVSLLFACACAGLASWAIS